MNDKIQFTREEWEGLIAKGLDDSTTLSKWLHIQASLPDLIHRSKYALEAYPISNPTCYDLMLETQALHDDCKANISTLRDRLTSFDKTKIPAGQEGHFHAMYLKSLGMTLATGILLNCILSAFVSSKACIVKESHEWSQEIYELAQSGAKYQPLGAMVLTISLDVAWVGAADAETKAKIWALVIDYDQACLGQIQPNRMAGLERMQKRFSLLEVNDVCEAV